jgi:succinate dehydrogenase/fumarate reductase cytochrome b subunit
MAFGKTVLLHFIDLSFLSKNASGLIIGAACLPMDYSIDSTLFFYCFFFPLLFGVPLLFVGYAAYQIWKNDLLPPMGRRRTLAIYFFRLAAVFLIMWLPGLFFLFVAGAWVHPWVEWAGGLWSHLQCGVSAGVSLMKPDIWQAFRDFWCCCRPKSTDGEDDANIRPSTETSSGFFTTWSVSFRKSFMLSFNNHSNASGSFVSPSGEFISRQNSSGLMDCPPFPTIPEGDREESSRHPFPKLDLDDSSRQPYLDDPKEFVQNLEHDLERAENPASYGDRKENSTVPEDAKEEISNPIDGIEMLPR